MEPPYHLRNIRVDLIVGLCFGKGRYGSCCCSLGRALKTLVHSTDDGETHTFGTFIQQATKERIYAVLINNYGVGLHKPF